MIDIISILALGLVVIVHPCTAAPNFAAMAWLWGKADGRGRVLWMYVVGHTSLYVLLGTLATFLARRGLLVDGELPDADWLQRLLALVFAVAGAWLMFGSLRHDHTHLTVKGGVIHLSLLGFRVTLRDVFAGAAGAFLTGALLALAFCPEAAVAFFGIMLPLSVTSEAGWMLPAAFAAGSALPLSVVAALMNGGRRLRLTYLGSSARWFNLVIGMLFLGTAVVMLLF